MAPFPSRAGCQYFTGKPPQFAAVLQRLEAEGVVAPWGTAGRIGDLTHGAHGVVDLASYAPYPGERLLACSCPHAHMHLWDARSPGGCMHACIWRRLAQCGTTR